MNFQNSGKTCREHEAYHRLIAAEAWVRQAEEAEAKEDGLGRLLSAEDAAIAREFQKEDNPTPTE